MRNRKLQLALAFFVTFSLPVLAHDVPNIEHTHAFKQTGYGSYRQGHSVNGPQGSIIIWSPQTYSGYQAKPPVKFARPEPITRPPAHLMKPAKQAANPTVQYGRDSKRDYGD